jgi:predicted HTH domain antitoxin
MALDKSLITSEIAYNERTGFQQILKGRIIPLRG